MAVSTFLFYVGNLMLMTAYLVIGALSVPAGGITGTSSLNPLQRSLAAVFFLLGAFLHADMALHVIQLRPFFDPDGRIAWDLTAIVFFEMVAVFLSLSLILRQKRRDRRQHRR